MFLTIRTLEKRSFFREKKKLDFFSSFLENVEVSIFSNIIITPMPLSVKQLVLSHIHSSAIVTAQEHM